MTKKKVDQKPAKKQKALAPRKLSAPTEATLFKHVSAIIEKRKHQAYAHVNQEITLMFWEVGGYINKSP